MVDIKNEISKEKIETLLDLLTEKTKEDKIKWEIPLDDKNHVFYIYYIYQTIIAGNVIEITNRKDRYKIVINSEFELSVDSIPDDARSVNYISQKEYYEKLQNLFNCVHNQIKRERDRIISDLLEKLKDY